jgi:hypothetical protein
VLAPRKLRNISKKNARSQAVYQHLQYLDANTLLKNNCADASSRRYASDKKTLHALLDSKTWVAGTDPPGDDFIA